MALPNGLTYYKLEGRNRLERRICGSFFPDGSSAVPAATIVGYGFTVTRTGVGTFDIDFEKAYPKLASFHATPHHATVVNHCRVVAKKVDADGSITGVTIKNYNPASPGVATELAAAATTFVSFEACLLESKER